jgi:hypothetical protein
LPPLPTKRVNRRASMSMPQRWRKDRDAPQCDFPRPPPAPAPAKLLAANADTRCRLSDRSCDCDCGATSCRRSPPDRACPARILQTQDEKTGLEQVGIDPVHHYVQPVGAGNRGSPQATMSSLFIAVRDRSAETEPRESGYATFHAYRLSNTFEKRSRNRHN